MQNFDLKCKEHPSRTISYIYAGLICPYPSRLACRSCISYHQDQFEGYVDIQNFFEDPLPRMTIDGQQTNLFTELKVYFDKAEKEPHEVIQYYQKRINKLIDNLKSSLDQGIQEYMKFYEFIKKAKIQLIKSSNPKLLIQQFENFQSKQNQHDEKEWEKLENDLTTYFKQFQIQENQELKEILQILRKNEKDFFDQQILSKFTREVDLTVGQMIQNLLHMGTKNHFFSNIYCSNLFSHKLLKYIDEKQRFIPKLIFKGTQSGGFFWKHCENKGPTLIICKSQNESVFGGFTPLKWCQGKFNDPTSKSFLFNCQRQEFYPFNGNCAISYSRQTGFCFGSGEKGQYDLQIEQNKCKSNLGNQYKINEYQTETTRLMGQESQILEEMEVYLIQQI